MSEPALHKVLEVRLRPVRQEDARRLFDWVNRPDSLAASLVTRAAVSWDSHCAWLRERLADTASRLWIVMADGREAGQIRLQNRGRGPEVALYIEDWARGRAVAATALDLALSEARLAWPGASVTARVRLDNARSRRFFERCGFRLSETTADHWIFSRSP